MADEENIEQERLNLELIEDAPTKKEPFHDQIGSAPDDATKEGPPHRPSAADSQEDSDAVSQPTGNGGIPPPHVPSHFRNPDIPRYLRYGVPVFFALTFALLLASDLGSGVAAYRQLTNPLDPSQNSVALILQASVFTSVAKLWGTGSYALTILIVIASISWPFVKILLSLYAWMIPFHTAPRRRERLLEVIDALGKWSFVDVVVFTEIVVTFRSTVLLGGSVVVEIYLVPRWGLFGFVTANMLNLMGTQVILHQHRRIIYPASAGPPDDGDAPPPPSVDESKGLRAMLKRRTVWSLSALFVVSFVLYLWGVLVYIFQVSNKRGGVEIDSYDYSIVNVGAQLPDSAVPGNGRGKYVWLQIIWYILGVGLPLLSMLLFKVLLWAPWSRPALEKLFFASEVVFAWSCSEVFALSTLFAVAQIPAFGNGLINSGCAVCFVVESQLLPFLALVVLGAATHVVAACATFAVVHPVLYRRHSSAPSAHNDIDASSGCCSRLQWLCRSSGAP